MGKRKPTKDAPPAPVISSPPPVPRRVDAMAIASLVLLQLVFWWRAALLRGFVLTSDICYQFEPMKSLLHESLRAGRLALWSPYIFCGYPLAAEGQVATFYPPTLLLSWLLDGGGAVNWLLISHLILAAVSLYLLARLLGISPFGAWLAGVTLSFSGYLFAHHQHVGLVCTAAWLPLAILCVERAWRGPLLPNAARAALVWAMAALAGHPQTLFHISLVMVFWVIWRTAGVSRMQAGSLRSQAHRAVGLLAITFLLGAGVAAVQLLLTKDLSAAAPHGDRGSLAYVTSFSLLGKHLFGLLRPNFQGSPAFQNYQGERYYWEYVLYLGLLPLALAVVGAVTRRGWALAGLVLGALILALAEGNPLYHVLRHLPGFAEFRAPARFIYVFTFAAALLAGMGWDMLARQRWLRVGRREMIVGAVVAVLVLGDLWSFDHPLAALTSRNAYYYPNEVAETLQRDPSWWRALFAPKLAADAEWVPPGGWAVNPNGWEQMRLALGADVPQSYGVRSISGYAAFVDPNQGRFFGAAYGRLFQAGDPRLLALVGTRYFALPAGTNLPDLDRLDIGEFSLYRNPDSFPRAFVVGEVSVSNSESEALSQVLTLADANRLREAAVVTGEFRGITPAGKSKAEITKITELRPEHVAIAATSDREALLVLNERWDPGWRAVCDGRPTPLVEVDTVLMGAALPKGEHSVEFVYRPRGLRVGVPITLVSLAVCLGLIVVPAITGRRKQTTLE